MFKEVVDTTLRVGNLKNGLNILKYSCQAGCSTVDKGTPITYKVSESFSCNFP